MNNKLGPWSQPTGMQMIFPASTDKEFALTEFKDKTACNVLDPICGPEYTTLQPLSTYNYVL